MASQWHYMKCRCLNGVEKFRVAETLCSGRSKAPIFRLNGVEKFRVAETSYWTLALYEDPRLNGVEKFRVAETQKSKSNIPA